MQLGAARHHCSWFVLFLVVDGLVLLMDYLLDCDIGSEVQLEYAGRRWNCWKYPSSYVARCFTTTGARSKHFATSAHTSTFFSSSFFAVLVSPVSISLQPGDKTVCIDTPPPLSPQIVVAYPSPPRLPRSFSCRGKKEKERRGGDTIPAAMTAKDPPNRPYRRRGAAAAAARAEMEHLRQQTRGAEATMLEEVTRSSAAIMGDSEGRRHLGGSGKPMGGQR